MEMCGSLIKWLETFNVSRPMNSVNDLMDGVAMAQVLHQISPKFFNTTWLEKIKVDTANNWRLKASNLKKILKAILDFYAQDLQLPISDQHIPDVSVIVERGDMKELGRLLQLILGCAVNCDDKHEYIQRIMGMEESLQHVVMMAIQELMTRESDTTTKLSTDSDVDVSRDQIRSMTENMKKLSEEKEVYAQRCHDLDQHVIILMEEKCNLQAENDRLNDRLNQAESLDDPNNWKEWPDFLLSTPAGRRYQQLQRQSEQLQEELFRADAAKDDMRIKCELLEKDLYELQNKNEELLTLTEESRSLRDEVDILRHNSDKVVKYESTITNLKKKLEEMSDLKSQLKSLEEKNMIYMQKNIDLEEEVKRSNMLRTQMDAYKRQVQDLQLKINEETKRADKAEFEYKRHQEKLASIQRDKERLIEERDSLKDMNEELRCSQLQPAISEFKDSQGFELLSLSPEVREEILRLQHENKMLKLQTTSSDDYQILKTTLEDTNSRKHELECELRSQNQKILELEARIEDLDELQQKISSDGDSTSSELKKRFGEQIEKCQKTENELQTFKNRLEESEAKIQASTEEIQTLNENLVKKDNQLKEMEERYKRYLEKAKNVIKQLDPRYNPNLQPGDAQYLKLQLNEKEKYIQMLEKDIETAKSVRDTEDQLMVSAFYHLSSSLHKKSVEDRLSLGNVGQQSFLSRQRQAYSRRTPSTPVPNAGR